MKKTVSAIAIKQTILYLYGIYFCHANSLKDYLRVMDCQLNQTQLSPENLRAACSHITAFHRAEAAAAEHLEIDLYQRAQKASAGQGLKRFKEKMAEIAALPGRSKLERRLHHLRGCKLCKSPCEYGYFSLLAEPDFERLFEDLSEFNSSPGQKMDPVEIIWDFTKRLLTAGYGGGGWAVEPVHLGNLSYCMISLATAKSRYPFPEKTMGMIQGWNQDCIQSFYVTSD